MHWIEVILSAPLFILSTGLLFQERFRQNIGVVVITALVAIISSIFTFQQIRGYLFSDEPGHARAQNEQQIQNSNQQPNILLELQKERAERERLAAELERQKQQNVTNVTTQQKPDTDQQRVDQLKDMGIALVDNVFRLMMGEIDKKRQ
jgi:hypothetical protein